MDNEKDLFKQAEDLHKAAQVDGNPELFDQAAELYAKIGKTYQEMVCRMAAEIMRRAEAKR